MPQQMPELFNGGVVTARHPSLLESGELQRGDECIYRMNDPSIEGAPGRSLYNVFGARASRVKGLSHLTFDDQTDQLLLYQGTTFFTHDFVALTDRSVASPGSPVNFTEMSSAGQVRVTVSSNSILANTLVIASCTITGTAVSSAAAFVGVVAGMVVMGTGVSANTTVLSVTDTSNIVLSQAASNGTVTLTFTGYPFLADIVGSRVFGLDASGAAVPTNAVIASVSVQDGSTGHYNTATLATTATITNNGVTSLSFEYGVRASLPDAGAEKLEIVNVGNQYYVGTGGIPQRLGYRAGRGSGSQSFTMRPMGLNPVSQPFTLATTAGAWNTSTTFGAGYYWFVITEAYSPGPKLEDAEKDPNLASEIVESIYTGLSIDTNNPTADPNANKGRPIAINISSPTTQGVLITLPAVTNTGIDGRIATNWNVYMAGPTIDARSQPSLASFRRVKSVTITTYAAGGTITLSEPTVAPQSFYATTQAAGKDAGGTTRSNFSNPTRALNAPDHSYAFAVSGSGTPNPACIQLGGWGFNVGGSYATASIVGIQVDVYGASDVLNTVGKGKTGCYIHIDTASKHSIIGDQMVFGAVGIISQGGAGDTLGAAWVTGDLSTIAVTVCKSGSNSAQQFDLDAVKLTVYFTGGTINLNGPAYRVITYRNQVGTTVSDPANQIPPDYTTSALFQGMLVTNDVTINGTMRYSLPNQTEYFPTPYFMKLFTRRKDIITCLRTVGQVLVCGMRDNIRRINYLPTETDTDFGISGSAQEPLAEDHGIAGPLAAALFDMPGGGAVLFYISTAGPRLTDGITTRPANEDLNWRNTVNLDFLSNAVVRVYPREQWIVVYYSPAGTTHGLNTKALVFHYGNDKLKDGMLPVTGPITVSGRASTEANLTGTPLILTANENDFNIYVEDQGFVIPASATVANSAGTPTVVQNCPLVRTRRAYAAGQAHLAREEKVYVMRSTAGTSTTATGTTTVSSTDVTSSAAFGSVVKGMRVTGTGIKPGTVVTLVTSSSDITISQPALATGTVTLTFDTGTFTVTVRGSNIDEDVYALDTSYASSLNGDLTVVQNDNSKQALEYQFEKVLMPDATHADLGVLFKLHSMTPLMTDMGLEQNRA